MTTNGTYRTHWTLFRRPLWKGIVRLVIYFYILRLVAASHRLSDYALCGVCSAGYFFLYDCYREFVYPAALRFLHWVIFFPVAFAFSLGSGLAVEALARALDIPPHHCRPVIFMLVIAGVGALGCFISKAARQNYHIA